MAKTTIVIEYDTPITYGKKGLEWIARQLWEKYQPLTDDESTRVTLVVVLQGRHYVELTPPSEVAG